MKQLLILLLLHVSVQAEPVKLAFDPIGKTEEQICANFGEPQGRIDMGGETTLMYSNKNYVLENGVATEVKDTVAQPISTPEPTAVASDKEALKLYLSRLKDDLVLAKKNKDAVFKEYKKQEAVIKEQYDREIDMLHKPDPSQRSGRGFMYINDRADIQKKCAEEIARLETRMLKPARDNEQRVRDDIAATEKKIN